VYGVVPATARAPVDVQGVGTSAAPVELVRHGRVAALVSEIDPREPLGTPDDLRAHAQLLDGVAAASTPVLPFRFGGVVRDREAVVDELLGPSEETFTAALGELGDLVQFTIRGDYRQDQVLREILEERPDIARLSEQTRGMPVDAGHPQQVKLGEMVALEIAARREADGRALLDRLAPLAVATAGGSPTGDQAVDAAFLVHRGELQAFETATEHIAREWAYRIDLRLLGPLAPYDFAAAVVEQVEGAM
jgi:hypothetical protein